MEKIFVFILLFISSAIHGQFTCFENKEHPLPSFSDEAKKNLEAKLAVAKSDFDYDSTNADNIIWLGRRTAYLGDYKKAIEIFTLGIKLHPQDARLYRHRGHRFITLRCFDKAIADFRKAAAIMKGKPDEAEPDGLPNAKNIPTSTLQSNIWYHLGLAYFIKGEYKKALEAYEECVKVSDNPDMYVATANWLHLTLRRLKKNKEADELLKTISSEMNLIENTDYYEIILLYKRDTDFADPLAYLENEKAGLGLASFGFGLGCYLLFKGDKENARKIFERICNTDQWSSFGYVASEAELKRLSKK
ncbi:MAG: tetratricopeptide repeat protein [Bacteroidia bacterium]|nr:tetratricopeptide repeat protein [Bacteroidia bacterium]